MSANFGAPPPPPPPSMPGGAIPSRRLPTQMPEAPACVQNAMMTKDKKPFTYTPGGIDLSQIKSPRMARRIERNANSEGVTNTPKPSPLAQQQQQQAGPQSPKATMAASAMGMPVQVFPGGGMPKPPPPPPPQMMQKQQNGNSNSDRKSSKTFEPPPFGCRPEIKIPPNPMATLRPVPKPQPKDDFWVQEYRKERSKSPNVQEALVEASSAAPESARSVSPVPPPPVSVQQQNTSSSSPVVESAVGTHQPPPTQYTPPTAQYTPPTPQYMPPSSPLFTQQEPLRMKPALPENKPTMLKNNISSVRRSPSPLRQDPPVTTTYQLPQKQPLAATPQPPPHQVNRANRWNAPSQNVVVADQKPLTVFNNVATGRPDHVPISSAIADGNKPCTNEQLQNAVKQALSGMGMEPQQQQRPLSPAVKPSQVGSLYIPPIESQVDSLRNNKQATPLVNQQTPTWMQTRHGLLAEEQPQWVNRDEVDGSGFKCTQQPMVNHHQEPLPSQQMHYQQKEPAENVRVIYQQPPQVNQTITTSSSNNSQSSTGRKERIIPIQLEATPSPTKAPLTPGFGPQPYYNMGQQQYSSVQSPGGTVYNNNSPSIAPSTHHNPNQFVDQGYNSFGAPVELGFNNTRGPILTQPMVLQRGKGRLIVHDCPLEANIRFLMKRLRDPISGDQSWGNTTPSQSKSFRILQQITDTIDLLDKVDEEHCAQAQPPQFARQMDANEQQLRRMQMNEGISSGHTIQNPIIKTNCKRLPYQDGSILNNNNSQYVQPSEQQTYEHEPRIYTGSNIPSRSFKMLEAMTAPENAARSSTDSNERPPPNTYPSFRSPSSFLPPPSPTPHSKVIEVVVAEPKLRPREMTGRSSRPPSIVVTPTPDDINQEPFILQPHEENLNPFLLLSEKLANYSNAEDQNNSSSHTKNYMGDDDKFFNHSSAAEDVDSDDSSTSVEVEVEHISGLTSIRSVSDVNVYSEDNPTPYSVQEEDSDVDEDVEEEEDCDEIDPHQLSVILEESSEKTKTSIRSNSTDCSSTLANDNIGDELSSENEDSLDDEEEEEDEDDDEKNLVSVSLPLRLSFSRSTGTEKITTTVVVGNSSENKETQYRAPLKLQTSDTDVSVSFSIPSRSNSVSRSLSVAGDQLCDDNSDDDGGDEVSVSVSLPLTRNKYGHKCLSLDTDNENTSSDKSEVNEGGDRIDDIWGEASPAPVRKQFAVYTNNNDDILTENDSSEESEDEETEDESENEIVRSTTPPKYKIESLIKCQIKIVKLHLQAQPYHSMIVNLQKPLRPEISYIQERVLPRPEPEYASFHRPTTPDISMRPSQMDMMSIHSRLRSITPVRTHEIASVPEKITTTAKDSEEKINVRQRVHMFERIKSQDSVAESQSQRNSWTSSIRESIDESGDEDSGVTSDHNQQVSDSEYSESDNYTELRKLSSYQRAATHSRLFKLLKEECADDEAQTPPQVTENTKMYSRKKIVHNVSITRRNNPNVDVETMAQRRERLSLPLLAKSNSSIEDMSSAPPSSGTSTPPTANRAPVSDQLINELIQSFMKKQKNKLLRNVSMEKIHEAARKALQEDPEYDSVIGSVSSTPAITPQEFTNGYSDYYDSFQRLNQSEIVNGSPNKELPPFTRSNRMWSVKCPRVLSSKTINRDLSLIRESESPEPMRAAGYQRSLTPSGSATPTPYTPLCK